MSRIPFDKVVHTDPMINRIQQNVEVALNRLGAQTLDNVPDGVTHKRAIGVDFTHLLTTSGLAAQAVTAAKIANGTVTGTQIATATVSVANLAPCNQFFAYRTGAFRIGQNANLPYIPDTVLKDGGSGFNSTLGTYTIPAGGAGDWQFHWLVGVSFNGTEPLTLNSYMTVNSGVACATDMVLTNNNGYIGNISGKGNYFYCNALPGDSIAILINLDSNVSIPMTVTSGQNFFSGYQVR